MRRWSKIVLLLAHCLRRWTNSKPTLGQLLMFAGDEPLKADMEIFEPLLRVLLDKRSLTYTVYSFCECVDISRLCLILE